MKSEKITLLRYVHDLQSRGRYFFDRAQATRDLKISESAFKQAAYRLTKQKIIRKIKSGFFTIIPVEYSHTGALPATWFIDSLMEYLEADYYVGLLSAAAIHGASHQQAMLFQVISNKIIPKIVLGNVVITFHFRKTIPSHTYLKIKTETGQMKVSTPEMTICDCLQYIRHIGHINNFATLLLELQNQINIDHLIQYIKEGYLELVNTQRLGYLIEFLNLPLNTTLLYEWVKNHRVQYRLLVPYLKKTDLYNDRWKMIINETVEPDDL